MSRKNITSTEKSMESLHVFEIFYNSLFKNNQTPMLLINPETSNIEDCNRAACSFYGYSFEQLIKLKITEINTLTEEEVAKEMQLAKTEQRNYFNFKHKLANQRICDVEVISTPIVYDDKILLLSSITDLTNSIIVCEKLRALNTSLEKIVTERTYQLEEINAELEETNAMLEEEIQEKTKTEVALKREVAFNNALLENMLEGVAACDADGSLALFNRTLREWHGMNAIKLPKEERAGYYNYYQKDGTTPLKTESMPLIRAFEEENLKDADIVICAKDQPIRQLRANGRAFYDDVGRKLGAVVVMRDVTKQLEEETQLKKLNSSLESMVFERTYQLEEVNSELMETNAVLEEEVEERQKAEEEVRNLNNELERKVLLRTNELKEKNIMLDKSITLFTAILESSPEVIVFALDRNYCYIAFNNRHKEAIWQIWGKEIAIGLNILDIIGDHEDGIKAKSNFDRALAGESFTMVEDYGNETLSRLFWQDYWSPIFSKDGEIIGLTCFVLNITDRMKAEDELRESEEKYRTLYETSGIGIGYYKLDGTIISYNRLAAVHMGGTPSDFKGKSIYDVFPKQDADFYMERLKRAAVSENKLEFEDKVSLPTGELWFLSTFVKIFDVENHIIGIQIISQDITTLKQSEIALAKSKEAAEEANIAKSLFLANMSHEIRTPLNGMMGMLQLLQMTELTEDQADYIKVSKTSSDSLLNVINDILDYSKIEAGKLKIEKLKFNFNEFIYEIVTMFKPSILNKGLVMNMIIKDNVPDFLVGDSFRLRQIISNFVGNAIKFTNEGEIDIIVRKIKEVVNMEIKLEFTVRDTGIGIPRDKIDGIFKSFNQADSSITRQYGGTGLGLSICKGLVEKMNGEIWAESKEGEGSAFHFTCVLGKLKEKNSEEKEFQKIEKSADTNYIVNK